MQAIKRIPAVMPIVFINIGIFFLQMVFKDSFTESLLLHQGDLWHAPWTLITSMFLHANAMHLFFNMYTLIIFGPLLEEKLGSWRFLLAYLGTGIFAGIISQFVYPAALGASGAVMGIVGVIIMVMPNLPVFFFFVIRMPLWVAGIVIAGIDLLGVFGIGFSGIANLAHLAGLGVGLGIGYLLGKQKQTFYKKFTKSSEMDDNDIEEYLKSGRI